MNTCGSENTPRKMWLSVIDGLAKHGFPSIGDTLTISAIAKDPYNCQRCEDRCDETDF